MSLQISHIETLPRPDGGPAAVRGERAAIIRATRYLALAAAPTFALMAVLSAGAGGGEMICTTAPDGLSLNGMAVMYLLMSAFHTAPWLKWFAGQGPARR